MQLEEKTIFVTSIYSGYLDNIDSEKILQEAYKIKEFDVGRKMPDYAGWHSNQISVDYVENTTEMIKVVQGIYSAATNVASVMGYERGLTFNVCWLNINGPGHFNEQHRHPSTHLSAVYYLKAEKNSGNISFIRDGRVEDYFPSSVKNTAHTTPRVSEPALTNKFYIFPSHIDHKVDPNMSNEDRISMAFNFSFQ
jgi:uncharacterized protein (TIGR02466 family)